MAPRTRWARNGDVHIAYQVFGEGPIDLLYVQQAFSCCEHLWELPRVARFFDRLGSFARVITFDRRESGMSDRLGRPSTLEEQMDDVIAVLDAAGSDRAGIFAMLEGGTMAMMFAASHPERTRALVLYAAFARTTWAPGYEWAPTKEERRARMELINASWGEGGLIDAFAPSVAHDDNLRAWLGKLQRLSMSPGAVKALSEVNDDTDVRDVLPSIRVPTLVMHREHDQAMQLQHSRYIASAIPDARLKILPGSDNLPFVGDTESVLGEMEEFLTGARHTAHADRVLATVLITDICESTVLAARLGDSAWRELLSDHHEAAERLIARYQGRWVKSTGDGVLATFDGPARAIRAGRALADDARRLGLDLRVGVHTGEVELIGDDVGGLAVHIAVRVMAGAEPGEVRVSSTVRDLVVGSELEFEDRGSQELRGVPGEWHLWALAA